MTPQQTAVFLSICALAATLANARRHPKWGLAPTAIQLFLLALPLALVAPW